ncbi:lipopolysaccharide biosynthesis protein [Acidobacteriota bacterium]
MLSTLKRIKRGFDTKYALTGGIATIALSKFWFLLTGYAMFFGLSRFLTTEQFGIYGVVFGVFYLPALMILNSTQTAVSKFVSESPDKADAIKRDALRLELVVGLLSVGVFCALSGPLARALKDPLLAPYFRLSSPILLFFACLAVFLGYLNGLKKFSSQASIEMAHAGLKISLVLVFAALTGLVGPIILGFVASHFIALLCVVVIMGLSSGSPSFGRLKILKFQAWIALFVIIVQLYQTLDLLLVKALSAVEEADRLAGLYKSAQTIAFVPYVFITTIHVVVFPMISESTAVKVTDATRRTIRTSSRVAFCLLTLASVLIAANPAETIRILYPEPFGDAGPVLAVLVFGMMFFTLLFLAAMYVSGSGRARLSAIMASTVLVLDGVLCFWLIGKYGMMGAAWGTSLAMLGGYLLFGAYCRWRFKAFLPLRSLVLNVIGGGAVYFLARLVPGHGWTLILEDVALGVVFLIVMRWLGELKMNEHHHKPPIADRD